MSAFPINDWQFWVATAAVVVALWFVVQPFLPRRSKSAACPSCPSKLASPQSQSRDTAIPAITAITTITTITMEGTKIRTP